MPNNSATSARLSPALSIAFCATWVNAEIARSSAYPRNDAPSGSCRAIQWPTGRSSRVRTIDESLLVILVINVIEIILAQLCREIVVHDLGFLFFLGSSADDNKPTGVFESECARFAHLELVQTTIRPVACVTLAWKADPSGVPHLFGAK